MPSVVKIATGAENIMNTVATRNLPEDANRQWASRLLRVKSMRSTPTGIRVVVASHVQMAFSLTRDPSFSASSLRSL